jgi:hypothetical protein
MPSDLFERLSKTAVPPPPPELDQMVHHRVNSRLLAGQLIEFALRAVPVAMWHLGRAVFCGLLGPTD